MNTRRTMGLVEQETLTPFNTDRERGKGRWGGGCRGPVLCKPALNKLWMGDTERRPSRLRPVLLIIYQDDNVANTDGPPALQQPFTQLTNSSLLTEKQ